MYSHLGLISCCGNVFRSRLINGIFVHLYVNVEVICAEHFNSISASWKFVDQFALRQEARFNSDQNTCCYKDRNDEGKGPCFREIFLFLEKLVCFRREFRFDHFTTKVICFKLLLMLLRIIIACEQVTNYAGYL